MDRSPASVDRHPTHGATLEARGLSVTLDRRTLLAIERVQVRAGDRILATADSGESLTCLAHVLAGLVPSPWRRAVSAHDWSRDLAQFESRTLSGTLVFDRLQLIARTLLVPEDLDTWFAAGSGFDELTSCGWVPEEDPALDRRLMRLVDRGLLARPLYSLSGGEKQRVALAVTLVLRPECLVLLNAFGWLDRESRSRALDTLLELDAAIVFCDDHLETLADVCSAHWHLARTGQLLLGEEARSGRPHGAPGGGHRLAVTRPAPAHPPSGWAIEGRHLSFAHVGFDPVRVLVDATFAIPRVSDVYLVGANGSGKSTLAALACGLEARYAGSLSVWNGGDATAEPSRLRVIQGAGAPQLLFQFVDDNLIRWTVGDYLRVGTDGHELADRQDVIAWLEQAGVSLATRVPAMDMFQKKLAVLGRMAITGCRLAFFDEPAWGLTRSEQARLLTFVDRFLGDMVRIWITHETRRVPYPPEAIVRIAGGGVMVEA